MTFEGQIAINAPHRQVWDFFQNVDELAQCIPGCKDIEQIDAERYRALMVEKVGMFRVRFAMEVKIDEISVGEFIRASVRGSDSKLASSFRQTLTATFIDSNPAETRVDLSTDVHFLGKIAGLGHSIIKRKADEALRKFGDAVKARLEPEALLEPEARLEPEI